MENRQENDILINIIEYKYLQPSIIIEATIIKSNKYISNYKSYKKMNKLLLLGAIVLKGMITSIDSKVTIFKSN